MQHRIVGRFAHDSFTWDELYDEEDETENKRNAWNAPVKARARMKQHSRDRDCPGFERSQPRHRECPGIAQDWTRLARQLK